MTSPDDQERARHIANYQAVKGVIWDKYRMLLHADIVDGVVALLDAKDIERDAEVERLRRDATHGAMLLATAGGMLERAVAERDTLRAALAQAETELRNVRSELDALKGATHDRA